MSAKIKIAIIIIATIISTGCVSDMMNPYSLRYGITHGDDQLVTGSYRWMNYWENNCRKSQVASLNLKECQDYKQLKGEQDRIRKAAGYKTPEQLAEQKREWDNVQKWFGFYNLTEGLNRQMNGTGSYDNQAKQANRKQDSRRAKCTANCNAGGGGSIQRYNNCQTYCESMFPEL